VENYDGITLWQDRPEINEVVSQQTARSMMTLLQAVTAHGTGAAVAQMKHPLGGKTGTTSDFTDAWFLGFSPSVTCGVWVGYDSRQSLGEKETGARAALPIWMAFMGEAIKGKDDEKFLADQEEEAEKQKADQNATKPGPAQPPAPQSKPAAPVRAAKPAQPAENNAVPASHPAGSAPSAPRAKAMPAPAAGATRTPVPAASPRTTPPARN